MKLITFILGTLLSTTAFAQYHYDYKTGNSYNTVGNSTYGYNTNTGSTWSSHTNGNNTYGTDSRGNSWNYNSQTGSYWNSNGTTCYGKGAARVCN